MSFSKAELSVALLSSLIVARFFGHWLLKELNEWVNEKKKNSKDSLPAWPLFHFWASFVVPILRSLICFLPTVQSEWLTASSRAYLAWKVTQNISWVQAESHCQGVSQRFTAPRQSDWLGKHGSAECFQDIGPLRNFVLLSGFRAWCTPTQFPNFPIYFPGGVLVSVASKACLFSFFPHHLQPVLRPHYLFCVDWYGFAVLFQGWLTIWFGVNHLSPLSLRFFINKTGQNLLCLPIWLLPGWVLITDGKEHWHLWNTGSVSCHSLWFDALKWPTILVCPGPWGFST